MVPLDWISTPPATSIVPLYSSSKFTISPANFHVEAKNTATQIRDPMTQQSERSSLNQAVKLAQVFVPGFSKVELAVQPNHLHLPLDTLSAYHLSSRIHILIQAGCSLYAGSDELNYPVPTSPSPPYIIIHSRSATPSTAYSPPTTTHSPKPTHRNQGLCTQETSEVMDLISSSKASRLLNVSSTPGRPVNLRHAMRRHVPGHGSR